MTSNEHPSPYSRQPRGFRPHNDAQPPIPHADENTLKSETIQIERKSYVFLLKENPRGRFIRIIEEANGHRSSVIIPKSGLESFAEMLHEMVKASAEIPPKNSSGSDSSSEPII